ncbi:MAG: beta/gamma crystallin-related protein [Alphaproteobacteria bacterium]
MQPRAAFLAAAFILAAPAALAAPPAPAAPVPLEIVVYDKPEFQGNAILIGKPVPDLSVLKFDNKVASLKIFGAGDWVLCENRNYQGRCARVAMEAVNLKLQNLNDRVSSLYPVPAPAAPPVPANPKK